MNRFEQLADAWAGWAWAISWQFALLVGLVAIACWLMRSASPRVRHALWLMALIKVLLPPSLAVPWGVGNWAVPDQVDVGLPWQVSADTVAGDGLSGDPGRGDHGIAEARTTSTSVQLMALWAAGATGLWAAVLWRYRRLSRRVDRMESIDEGPLRIELERLADRLDIARVPDLHVTPTATSPFLIGVRRPRIILPQTMVDEFTADELQTVLLHELVHWRRRDTWVGCGQVLVQGLLWFHPLVWWASAQLRHERENVCDDAVVRLGAVPPRQYGEVILRVLTTARGRSQVADSLVGVFERGAKLQQRLENVMSYDLRKRAFGWASWAFLSAFAVLFLPMGRSDRSQADSTGMTVGAVANATISQADTKSAKATTEKPPYPVIVSTEPEIGTTGVSASLSEITVTFDRDMGGGMSWTGGGPEFPPVDNSRKAKWTDDRTCVLPVALKRGQFYRVGINSKSYQNFASADGTPAPPAVISFVTEGANKAVERRVRVPEVVELDPAREASDVDPATSALRVTFNMPMGEAFSWTGGGESFPEVTDKPYWSKDGKTCTLPVKLKAGHEYQLGLNSLSHNNFQSKWGVPLKPVAYTFTTKGE